MQLIKAEILVDPEQSFSELIDWWKNSNRAKVLDILATDHAGLVAVMIVQGAQDGKLSREDCNEIANGLIDRRVTLCRQSLAAP